MAEAMPNKYVIVLVDDEPRIHEMIREVLQQAELVDRFESFYDPFSCIAFLKQKNATPDVVLLDVHFSNAGLSGVETIPYIREDYPYLPIILLTGMEGADIEGAQDYECVYYIPKPVKPEHLVRMVRFYLSTGRKSAKRVAELNRDLQEHKDLVQKLSTELAQIEIETWDKNKDAAQPKAFQRILDILQTLISTTELTPSVIADLENLCASDFQLFKKTVETIVRFDSTENTLPGMRMHRFHAAEGVLSLSITKKARLFFWSVPGSTKKRLLRFDPDHNDHIMEKWLKEYLKSSG